MLSSKIIEKVHNGRDNAIDLLLSSDNISTGVSEPADLSILTRIVITVGAISVDSDANPEAFDWSPGGGVLKLSLGAQGLAVGEMQTTTLVLYDAVNVSGIVWGDSGLLITVI